jgi:cold shock protein
MANGTVKKVLKDRGFGFIRTSDGKEIFFHRSECRSCNFEALDEGVQVEFDVKEDPKGPRALNVKLGTPS